MTRQPNHLQRLALLLGVACLGTACGVGRSTAVTSQAGGGGGGGVAVVPPTAQTVPGGVLNFTANVAGTAATVTWSVVQAGGGSIDQNGRYTAPAGTGLFNIMATSTVDTTKSGVATATVAPPSSTDTTGLLDPSRRTTWNPGLNAVGGIPFRGTIYKTLSPSGGDDTSAIQSALDSCPANQVVKLAAGTFNISGSGLNIVKSNITLRGTLDASGNLLTQIIKKSTMVQAAITLGQLYSSDKFNVAAWVYNLAADGVKGNNYVTLTKAPTGLAAGELVLVDQLSDTARTYWSPACPTGDGCRAYYQRFDRPITQILEVQNVSGNTVYFTTPLHLTFQTSGSAQLSRYANTGDSTPIPAVKYSGVEDLYVSAGANWAHGGNFAMEHTAYCWLRNVESHHSYEGGVVLSGTFRSEVRDSYVHEGWPVNGGAGYLFDLNYGSSDNLIENNISWNADKVIVFRCTGGGNVVGYNYMEDAWLNIPGYYNFVESGINAAHDPTPHMELFEGNESFRFDSDESWGNSIYITAFRNHLTGRRRHVSPLTYTDDSSVAITTAAHSYWFNFLGNHLGTAGMTASPQSGWQYDLQGAAIDSGNGAFWCQGLWDGSYAPPHTGNDNLAYLNANAPAIRHGNYNVAVGSVAAGIVWDATISNHTLPNSLYLTAKPSFFDASHPWPWVTPENTSSPIATLPARERFDAMPH